MNSPNHPNPNPKPNPKPDPDRPIVIETQPASPRHPIITTTNPFSTTPRKIALPVDLSDESAFAVRWAVQNYLRQGDDVTVIHVRPTSVLYGADWGSTGFTADEAGDGAEETRKKKQQQLEDDFDAFTASKIKEVAMPLAEGKIPYKVHIVKDHDMKERLCLEIERLGMSVVIMGSRGFGACGKRNGKGRLGSVSDYCVQHCVCPVVVVRFPEDRESSGGVGDGSGSVPESEPGFDDAPEDHLHKD